MDESAILHAVEMVQAGMCMEHEHVDQCVAAVEGILPIALPVLGEANRYTQIYCLFHNSLPLFNEQYTKLR